MNICIVVVVETQFTLAVMCFRFLPRTYDSQWAAVGIPSGISAIRCWWVLSVCKCNDSGFKPYLSDILIFSVVFHFQVFKCKLNRKTCEYVSYTISISIRLVSWASITQLSSFSVFFLFLQCSLISSSFLQEYTFCSLTLLSDKFLTSEIFDPNMFLFPIPFSVIPFFPISILTSSTYEICVFLPSWKFRILFAIVFGFITLKYP